MCSEGQVAHLYKYNGLSPRMFHTAWHFHYLKRRRRSADQLKSATNLHVIERHTCTGVDYERRPLMILAVKQMGGEKRGTEGTHTHSHTHKEREGGRGGGGGWCL